MPKLIMDMQRRVQLAVLRRLDRGQSLDRGELAEQIPGADLRDVDRAVHLLLVSGGVVWASGSPEPRLEITAAGRWILAEAAGSPPP